MIEQIFDGELYRFEIELDEDAESPREWSNLGHFYTWSSRYNSPDDNPYERYRDLVEELGYDPVDLRHRHKGVGFYVEKYEHGDVMFYLNDGGALSDAWDSCLIGVIYATREEISKWFGCKYITKKVWEKVVNQFNSELRCYAQWVNGYVNKVTCYDEDDNIVSVIGSVYGDEDDIEPDIRAGSYGP